LSFLFRLDKARMVNAAEALPGRSVPLPVPAHHHVLHTPMSPPWPEGNAEALFGLGCFWGAEKAFWKLEGVHTTAVGYAAGFTPNATYEEVCTGRTGHNEVVRVVFDPDVLPYERLLQVFWESHDPTQGMRQGNDVGTQYRSGIYVYDPVQLAAAEASKAAYAEKLAVAGYGEVTTEIVDATEFFFAEGYHQQYLAKNPERPRAAMACTRWRWRWSRAAKGRLSSPSPPVASLRLSGPMTGPATAPPLLPTPGSALRLAALAAPETRSRRHAVRSLRCAPGFRPPAARSTMPPTLLAAASAGGGRSAVPPVSNR